MRRVASALFLLGVATVPLMHPLDVHIFGTTLIPADILFAASGAAWLASVVQRHARLRWGPFPFAVAAYVAVVSLSGARTGTTSALDHVVIGFYVGGLAVLAYNLVPSVVGLTAVVKAWLIGAAVAVAVALVGILLFYAGSRDNFALSSYGGVPNGDYPRIAATFLNPNMLCNYLIVTGLLFMAAWELAWLSTAQFVTGLVGIGVAAAFTLSPGLGGLAVAAGVWAWASPRMVRSRRARRTVLTFGVLGAAGFAVLTCISLKFGSEGLRASGRVRLWRQWAASFVHHPVLGAGLARRIAYLAEGHLTDAHNVWLSVSGQMGALGLIALGAVVVVAARDAWPRFREPIPRALVIAFMGAFLYQGLSMSIEETRHVWLLVGLLAAVRQTAAIRAPLASRA